MCGFQEQLFYSCVCHKLSEETLVLQVNNVYLLVCIHKLCMWITHVYNLNTSIMLDCVIFNCTQTDLFDKNM